MANKLAQARNMIYEIREQKVMLDSDLAFLYEVEVKRLNEAVKRNIKRFPRDFMFRLTKKEFAKVVANCDHLQSLKYRSTLPYAFTEQGVAMLAAVLNSQKAIDVNIQIMRAFIKLRHYMLTRNNTDEQVAELRKLLMVYIENTDLKISKHDKTIEQIIVALNNLIAQPPKTKRIGFNAGN
jgi:phage regulator Rha-like protein